MGLRNPNIAVAVGAVVLVSGILLFRDAGEGAMQMVIIAMFVAIFGTLALLDARDERHEGRRRRSQ
jgi:hypothetical protein